MDQPQRKARIIELLERLKSGEDVARRDMESVLSEQQFSCVKIYWYAPLKILAIFRNVNQ